MCHSVTHIVHNVHFGRISCYLSSISARGRRETGMHVTTDDGDAPLQETTNPSPVNHVGITRGGTVEEQTAPPGSTGEQRGRFGRHAPRPNQKTNSSQQQRRFYAFHELNRVDDSISKYTQVRISSARTTL